MRSPLQFSVMREDPRLEERLLDRMEGEKRFFGITGAGCTLLQLATRPDLTALVGVDIDPHQTTWARFRLAAARAFSRKDFCRVTGISQIEPGVREGLVNKLAQVLAPEDRAFVKEERAFFVNGAFDEGMFERLFACWRGFLERFVVTREDIQRFFDGDRAVAQAMAAADLWPVSFELSFHQQLLLAIFGPDAVQHAPPGSYPRYFQSRFEWALSQPDAAVNPYLSHVMRGRYGALDHDQGLPDYLTSHRYERLPDSVSKVTCVTGRVWEALAAHPGPYHLIVLSNILDWTSEAESEAISKPVLEALAPGGCVLLRALNAVRPLPRAWIGALDFDPNVERELLATDRSFFYSAVRVGRKPR
jgi:S-adenosylmethionine-diacylglycerol 3-amino-3-carboxypropyl transferase